MSVYSEQIMSLDVAYKRQLELKEIVDRLKKQLEDDNKQYVVMLEAQKLLATVSDSNTKEILDYITGIINKALFELFPYDRQKIYLEKKLHANQYPHIVVRLESSDGDKRDLEFQTGTGERQVISFLFVVCLIEVRKGRKLLVMDELFSGLHPEAKRIIIDILQIFAENGFQFAMVEYGVNNVGKIYLVEKPNKSASITPMNGVYSNEVFVFNRPAEEIDKSISVDEETDDNFDDSAAVNQ